MRDWPYILKSELSRSILKDYQVKMNRRDEGRLMLFVLFFFAILAVAGVWIASIEIPVSNDVSVSSELD